MFIKLGDIPGEATVKGESGWIEITSVKGLPEGVSRVAAAGKREKKTITVVKAVDKSSPRLAEAIAKSAAAGDKSSPQSAKATRSEKFRAPVILAHGGKTYILHGGRVISATVEGNVETLAVSYESIEVKNSLKEPSAAVDYNSSRSNSAG